MSVDERKGAKTSLDVERTASTWFNMSGKKWVRGRVALAPSCFDERKVETWTPEVPKSVRCDVMDIASFVLVLQRIPRLPFSIQPARSVLGMCLRKTLYEFAIKVVGRCLVKQIRILFSIQCNTYCAAILDLRKVQNPESNVSSDLYQVTSSPLVSLD